MSRYNYRRRASQPVKVGGLTIGGDNAICVQSMTNLSTNDVQGCIDQALRIVEAGGQLVRLTTQGVREAGNIGLVRAGLRERGCGVPVVADVHFNPKAAFKAATTCDKVRINPGNFVDAARTFRKLEFTDDEYAAEIDRIRTSLVPFLDLCRAHGTAVRLGVNHGSLSDRIMSRYGDTPEGMVESVMEYLRICRDVDFNNIVISIKASNTTVMVRTVRLLVEAMDAEEMRFPLHLGVTEAGDGEDGRIKSAVGIAALLNDGLGDTIRVSLSEAPEAEIPVALALVSHVAARAGAQPAVEPARTSPVPTRTLADALPGDFFALHADTDGEFPASWHRADAASLPELPADGNPVILSAPAANRVGLMQSWIERFVALGAKNPVILSARYDDKDEKILTLKAAADLGAMLINGHGSGIAVFGLPDAESAARVELGILQAARLRFSKTEYIACPGCGRTLFDLSATLQRVKQATSHLKGLKIGVMGCIVNGPGEMADADYGYVGAAAGKISLYRGKKCIEMNIPQEEAIERLTALIKSDGRWRNPE
ncbi:MAG: (E)-4-hydroxy-3-methylbut-2-enyl-diphosphate synthase [Muribaculaceae bacterium]|nr:(E)-4-hydroxy-3-methylbut-2-enyl-diphosphate synthase [Muribaculaceae bacterium]